MQLKRVLGRCTAAPARKEDCPVPETGKTASPPYLLRSLNVCGLTLTITDDPKEAAGNLLSEEPSMWMSVGVAYLACLGLILEALYRAPTIEWMD